MNPLTFDPGALEKPPRGAYTAWLKAPAPMWLSFVMLAYGMFAGSWMQAESHADQFGTALSWASRAIFAAPMIAILACLLVARRIRPKGAPA